MAQTVNGVTTYFVGAHYELTGSQVTKYYFAGASRIAMRKYTIPQSMSVEYLLGDHLGSTSLAVNATGALITETRYKPWGEVRFTTANSTLPTRYTYTGQYSYINDEATDLGSAGFGLMFYNARWYDPAVGRFAQADSIIPNPYYSQAYDRFAYVYNSPLIYIDPTGHLTENQIRHLLGKNYDKLWALWEKYDSYWITILTELQIGDTLFASQLEGIGLQVHGEGGNITLAVLGGSYSANLWDWQGQGVYTIDRPGKDDGWTAQKRDEMFDQNEESVGLWYGVVEPVFDYSDPSNPTYSGARLLTQYTGPFESKSSSAWLAEAIGFGEGTANGFSTILAAVLIWSKPQVSLGIFAADLVVSLNATFEGPKVYDNGWIGTSEYFDINPNVTLDMLDSLPD